MPEAVLTITDVETWETRQGGELFLVKGFTPETQFLSLRTSDALKASLAEEARKQHVAVRVGYRDLRYGDRELITIAWQAEQTL